MQFRQCVQKIEEEIVDLVNDLMTLVCHVTDFYCQKTLNRAAMMTHASATHIFRQTKSDQAYSTPSHLNPPLRNGNRYEMFCGTFGFFIINNSRMMLLLFIAVVTFPSSSTSFFCLKHETGTE